MQKDYYEELNIISKTYLFFCDRKDLEEFVSISFSNGNNAKKVSFERRHNAFEKLSKRALELSMDEIELERFMDLYKEASDKISEKFKTKSQKENFVQYILDSMMSGEVDDTLEIAIYILILKGLLPSARAHNGKNDKGIDINSDFEKMFKFFDTYIKSLNYLTQVSPIVETQRNDFFDVIHDHEEKTYNNRFALAQRAKIILDGIRNLSSDERRIEMNNETNWIRPDIEGFWMTSENINTNDFWHIEKDDVAHFIFHHYYNGNCENHALGIQVIKDIYRFIVFSPKYARTVFEQGDANKELFSFYMDVRHEPTKLYQEEDDKIKRIDLDASFNPQYKIKFKSLFRVGEDTVNIKELEKRVKLSKDITEPKYKNWFTGYLSAITLDYLYLELRDSDKEILNTDKKYLAIKREGDFEKYTDIYSKIYLIWFLDDTIFLAFDDAMKYYKISDNKVFDGLGLIFTDTIE